MERLAELEDERRAAENRGVAFDSQDAYSDK